MYVSPIGSDANPGSLQLPFKTIQKAIDASGGKQIDTIFIKGGVYQLNAPLVFKPENSATASGLTIRNYRNESVVISGGKLVDGWMEKTKERLVGH